MLTYEQIQQTIETLCKIEGEKVGGKLSAEIRDCVFALQKSIETIGEPAMEITLTQSEHGITSSGQMFRQLPIGTTKFYTAPPALSDEWVSVDDMLPDEEECVLLLHKNEARIGALFREHPTPEETFDSFTYWDDWYQDGQAWDFSDVTHWMPLPKQPRW